MIRILFLGDIVGRPGRQRVIRELPGLKKELGADFVIVNAENSAGGRGITPGIAIDLLRAGAAVITTGDHAWDKREIADYFPAEPRLLRPINYPPGVPGQGSVTLETPKGKVAVINAQGRVFTQPPLENPFLAVAEEARRLREQEGAQLIFLDFHAEATSEKIAMAHAMDGIISAVVGTHTHVQTADERILPKGTAHLSDAGMCGPDNSVLGCEIEPVLRRFRTGMPARFSVAKQSPVRLCGALIDVDEATGKAETISRINRVFEKGDEN